jgi:hypothetical protein
MDLKNRARQKVIQELGYFVGKLGRERVLPLHLEAVELPGHIDYFKPGIHPGAPLHRWFCFTFAVVFCIRFSP